MIDIDCIEISVVPEVWLHYIVHHGIVVWYGFSVWGVCSKTWCIFKNIQKLFSFWLQYIKIEIFMKKKIILHDSVLIPCLVSTVFLIHEVAPDFYFDTQYLIYLAWLSSCYRRLDSFSSNPRLSNSAPTCSGSQSANRQSASNRHSTSISLPLSTAGYALSGLSHIWYVLRSVYPWVTGLRGSK